MIKVNTSTLEATRDELPGYLKGLSKQTLQNRQAVLVPPVRPSLADIEYWPAEDKTPSFDERTHTLGDEVLTADAETKTVSVVRARTRKAKGEVARYCRTMVSDRMNQELNKEVEIGGVMTSRAELMENRDLLDGSAASDLNLKDGTIRLTKAQQVSIANGLRSRHRASHKRAHAIIGLIKAASTGIAMIAVLDAEIDRGWSA